MKAKIGAPLRGRSQRVGKAINLEKHSFLHAEQASENRAEFHVCRLVGVHRYVKAGKREKRKTAQAVLERFYCFAKF